MLTITAIRGTVRGVPIGAHASRHPHVEVSRFLTLLETVAIAHARISGRAASGVLLGVVTWQPVADSAIREEALLGSQRRPGECEQSASQDNR